MSQLGTMYEELKCAINTHSLCFNGVNTHIHPLSTVIIGGQGRLQSLWRIYDLSLRVDQNDDQKNTHGLVANLHGSVGNYGFQVTAFIYHILSIIE